MNGTSNGTGTIEKNTSDLGSSVGMLEARRFRYLACFAAVAALGGSLWAATVGSGCGACHQAHALLAEVPLAWAGVAYYAALAFVTGWRGMTRGSTSGFFAAAGTHAVLVSLLVQQHIFCGGCLVAAAGAFIGAAASVASRPRVLGWALLPFALATLVTFGGIWAARGPRPPQVVATTAALTATQDLPDGATATRPEAGHIKLVLYEREGCKHCLQFDEEVLPRIREALGSSLEIEHREPMLDMETPTIVMVGKGSTTFIGVPMYKDFEAAALSLR